MITLICVLIYLVLAYFAFTKFIKNWKNQTWEKIIFSLVWPLAIPLYGIWSIHNKF